MAMTQIPPDSDLSMTELSNAKTVYDTIRALPYFINSSVDFPEDFFVDTGVCN